MDRRVSLRARTEFAVIARNGCLQSHCRGIEVSPTGMIVDRGRPVDQSASPMLMGLELKLPERVRSLRSMGTQQAFKFVEMSDADRLTLAEHIDVLRLRGVPLN